MVNICLDETTKFPIYQQIVNQVRQFVATGQLKPGEHLPAVRQLALSLKINPGTVAKAYAELERDGLVVSRRGGGTVVSQKKSDPTLIAVRQRRLSNMMNSTILDALSLGYNADEIEAAFYGHLDRWREEKKQKSVTFGGKEIRLIPQAHHEYTLNFVGSHDMALSILLSHLKQKKPEINIEITYTGSLGGLMALQSGKADIAGIHLLDEETGEYNYPYVKHILPGREMAIVHLAHRIQGLMFISNNPKKIKGIADLKRPDVTFVNRQKGSGTRLHLDLKLKQLGIKPTELKGYERELETHLAVAVSIASGEADVGLGIEAAAKARDLGFLPLFKERYDLVTPIEIYRSELFKTLLEIINNGNFRKVVDNIGGYDTSQTGTTTFCK